MCDWTFSRCCVNKSTLWIFVVRFYCRVIRRIRTHHFTICTAIYNAYAASPFPIIKFDLIFIEAMGIGGAAFWPPAQQTNKIKEGKINFIISLALRVPRKNPIIFC